MAALRQSSTEWPLGANFKSLASFLDELVLPDPHLLLVSRYASVCFDQFLKTTFVSHTGSLRGDFTDARRQYSLTDLIHQAVAHHLSEARFRPRRANVLCLGYRSSSADAARWRWQHGTDGAGVENYYPNTLHDCLVQSSETWECLHRLVGDQLIAALLRETTILQKVRGAESWLQITGPPLATTTPTLSGGETRGPASGMIPRHRMFYAPAQMMAGEGETWWCGLPFRHLLNKCRKGGADGLVERIFFCAEEAPPPTTSARKSPTWAAMKLFCSRLMQRHRKCPYRQLLDYHCADHGHGILSDSLMRVRPSPSSSAAPVTEHVQSHRRVTAFVNAVLIRLCTRRRSPGPSGRCKFVQQLRKEVQLFVRLRRYETLSIKQLVRRLCQQSFWMDVIGIPHYPNSPEARTQLSVKMEGFVRWLFFDLLIPLIKTCFYVTETACFKNRICYFRQDTWLRLSAGAVQKICTQLLEPLSAEFDPHPDCWGRLGYCRLRLIPKEEDGFRPVMSLRRVGPATRPSTNGVLRDLYAILEYHRMSRPECMGASIMGLNEVFARLLCFKKSARPRVDNGGGGFFVVKFDVRACFDSIPQERLLRVLSNLLDHDHYIVRRFELTGPQIRRQFRRIAFPAGGDGVAVEELCRMGWLPRRGALIVDRVLGQRVERRRVLKLLEDHILRNVVKVGSRYYRQKSGIPQGSMLSGLLCSLFYGDMDRRRLGRFVDDAQSLFMRFMDDTIFITPCYETVCSFVEAVAGGFPEYGVLLNVQKAEANFAHPLVNCRQTNGNAGQDWFRWCGLQIHTRSLQVQNDHCRLAGCRIADSLSIDRSSPAVATLERYLKVYMRPRLSPLLLDADLNDDWRRCAANIYEGALLVAIKAHAYMMDLQSSAGIVIRESLIQGIMERLAEYTGRRVARVSCHPQLRVELSRTLVLRAIRSVWSRRRGKYATLLERTAGWLAQAELIGLGELREELRAVERRLLDVVQF